MMKAVFSDDPIVTILHEAIPSGCTRAQLCR